MRANDLKKAPLSNGIHHTANLANIPQQTSWYPQIDPVQAGAVPRLAFEVNDATDNMDQQPLPEYSDNYTIKEQIDWPEWLFMVTSLLNLSECMCLISNSDIIDTSLFQFRVADIDKENANFIQFWKDAASRMLFTPFGALLYEKLYTPKGKIIEISPTISDCNFGFSNDTDSLLMPYNIDSKLNEQKQNRVEMSATILFHELLHAWHKREASPITPEMLYQIFISGNFLNTVCAYYGSLSGDKISVIEEIYNEGGKKFAPYDGVVWMSHMIDHIAVELRNRSIISDFFWNDVTIEEIMTVNPQSLTQRTYDYLCNLRGIDAAHRILNENAIRQELGLPLRRSYT